MIQRKQPIPSLSAAACRRRVTKLVDRLSVLAQVFKGHSPLIKGTLYERRRRCGRAGCRCERGQLHVSPALCLSDGGKARMVALRGLDLQKLGQNTENYRQFRQARAEFVKTCEELLGLIDRLDESRRMAPESLRGEGPPRGGQRKRSPR